MNFNVREFKWGYIIIHIQVLYIFFRVTLTFTLSDGSRQTAKAKVGDNLLDVIVENDLDVDGFGRLYAHKMHNFIIVVILTCK